MSSVDCSYEGSSEIGNAWSPAVEYEKARDKMLNGHKTLTGGACRVCGEETSLTSFRVFCFDCSYRQWRKSHPTLSKIQARKIYAE